MRRELVELRKENAALKEQNTNHYRKLNQKLVQIMQRQLMIQSTSSPRKRRRHDPVVTDVEDDEVENDKPHRSVSLSPKPKSLEDLWVEYTVGINGRKPASDFTSTERGNKHVVHKYCLQKKLLGQDDVFTTSDQYDLR